MPIISWIAVLGLVLMGGGMMHKKSQEAPPTLTAQESIDEAVVFDEPEPYTEVLAEEAALAVPEPAATKPAPPAQVPAPNTQTPAAVPQTQEVAVQPEPPTPEIPVAPLPPRNLVMSTVLDSLVNILCTSDRGEVRPMSGSGVIIDPSGIILTVAHVGQYFLLAEHDPPKATCVIRTGSPARPAYAAEVLYVSKSWVENNPDMLLREQARGTGEHDFALLSITGSTDGTPLPSSFTALNLRQSDTKKDESVVIAGYGAQFISSQLVLSSLHPTILESSVKDIYTFDRTTIDVISLGGSIASQSGSSGGAITDMEGNLIGLITTSSIEGPIESRDLRAITLRHIRQSFNTDTRTNLDNLLKTETPENMTLLFAADMQTLRKRITDALGF